MQGFHEIGGFTNVIGAVDCTYIKTNLHLN